MSFRAEGEESRRLEWPRSLPRLRSGPHALPGMTKQLARVSSDEAALLLEFRQTMPDPHGGEFFSQRVLLEALVEDVEIDTVERLILIEAGEHIAGLARLRVAVRLQTLRADLFHHALHRRVDRADREVPRLQVRLQYIVARLGHAGHHAVGADGDD